MTRKWRRILKWTRWMLLSLLLLPFAALLLMKLTGSMKMRKPDDQILGQLHSYPLYKTIDTAVIGKRNIVFLRTSLDEKPKKQAIIFVHGSPGSLDAFLKYMHNEKLLAKADLISYDRPGFGHSDFGITLPSLRGQASILHDLMRELKYDRYWLIGHSYGGAVIIQTAIDRAKKIAGIGIIAGSITYEMEPVAGWRKWIDLPFIRFLMPVALRVSNDELMSLRRDLRMIDDDWKEIEVPVSLIHGKKDILVPFGNLEVAQKKLIKSDSVKTLVLEEDNHFILWTKPDVIVDEILELIQSSR